LTIVIIDFPPPTQVVSRQDVIIRSRGASPQSVVQ